MAATPLTPQRAAILKALLKTSGQRTRQQIGVSRYDLECLVRDGFLVHAGTAKNNGTGGRKAVLYKLTAKGKRRASK